MKLINLKQAQKLALMEIKNHQFSKLNFYTWKKDRSINIYLNNGIININESGYKCEHLQLSNTKDAKHVIKKMFDREFPRSHKLYFSSVK